jgi:pyrroline-5-carboxylate reductase
VGVDLNTVHQSQKTNQPLMVSLMAGITVSTLIRWLGQAYPIVRAMPNMASSVYEGATGLYRHSSVSESQMAWTAELMSRLGAYAWLDHEDLIHSVIPLSGSAPAFYFYFAEIMSKVALEMGLDPTVVAQFSKQTLFGSGVLAHQSEKSFETLRAEVTSKKGTTDAAIQYFQAHGLENIIRGAMQACRNRSVEIAKIMEGEIL